ncbi:hypothetical protein Aduo_003168 [Ancylostoma duodenale]
MAQRQLCTTATTGVPQHLSSSPFEKKQRRQRWLKGNSVQQQRQECRSTSAAARSKKSNDGRDGSKATLYNSNDRSAAAPQQQLDRCGLEEKQRRQRWLTGNSEQQQREECRNASAAARSLWLRGKATATEMHQRQLCTTATTGVPQHLSSSPIVVASNKSNGDRDASEATLYNSNDRSHL